MTEQHDLVPNDAEPGGFIGDIFFGDASNSTRGTHRWNGTTWETLPTDAEALTELLAQSRSRIEALEAEVARLRADVSEVVKHARSYVDESGVIEIPLQVYGLLHRIHAENIARAALAGEQT